ncbi:DUF3949 domain-containing protein [Paenibacillus sp. N1-5-1-14]|uniref:DUF3949 domain-containing protein n=1 Tax=Paenibacillus radicibacter TaxID=2972488 RepID=UPI0021594730|nr:DUF3949 domain-containing protein [Paenibacillus radicibacter]MCR8643493.1 DUF3949 domain-containing protein [Paenibacillus radicibacter]
MSETVVFYIVIGILAAYVIGMVPLMYSYISEVKKKQAAYSSQNEMYEKMSFESEQAHFSVQGNILNTPSLLIATLIYKLRHRKGNHLNV